MMNRYEGRVFEQVLQCRTPGIIRSFDVAGAITPICTSGRSLARIGRERAYRETAMNRAAIGRIG